MRAIVRSESAERSFWRAETGFAADPDFAISHTSLPSVDRILKRRHSPRSFKSRYSCFKSPPARLPPSSA